jgi:hypothetical protein
MVVYSKEEIPGSLTISKDPRFVELGLRSIIHEKHLRNTSVESKNLYKEDKYNYAIPDGSDLIYEKSIALEYGLDALYAINFEKGCYVGQELISRTKYQGVVRKRIFKLVGEEDLSHVPKGSEILLNNEKIGIICSTYNKFGIGLVKMDDFNLLLTNYCYTCGIKINLLVPDWRK